MSKVSIIIPLYNEQSYIERCLHEVCGQDLGLWQKEVIVIDDGSTDDSRSIAESYARHPGVQVYSLDVNKGKGAAIREGLSHASGEVLLIQDADLEYDPRDIVEILKKYEDDTVGAVYGSRILGEKTYHTYASNMFFYYGGRVLTLLINILFGTSLTDQATCYKSWRARYSGEIIKYCTKPGFEFEIELTARLASLTPLVEVPIHYYPRSISHGKKIRLEDFLKSVWIAIVLRASSAWTLRA